MSKSNPVEIDTLRKFFEYAEVDFVFDVGANSGQYAKRLRNEINYEGNIASFEPIDQLAQEISNFAKFDHKWDVEAIALNETEGTKQFNIMQNSQFSSLRAPTARETNIFSEMNIISRSISVQCKTLDQIFNKYKEKYDFKRPFLKMDTQGSDINVVRGGLSVIRQMSGIQSELPVTQIYEGAPDYREVLYFYEGIGFSICSIFLPNRGHFPRLIDLDAVLINKDLIKN